MKNYLIRISVVAVLSLFMAACGKRTVTPDNALQSYLDKREKAFKWEVQDSIALDGIRLYRILFTSQTWRGIDWNHELTLMVPDKTESADAMLFITGGSIKDGKPNLHNWDEDLTAALAGVATGNRAVIALLWQVPNQPLYGDLTEDALISYTLHNYQNDKDFSWPLLFPMTKSAISAMDVVQEFAAEYLHGEVRQFVVSGASKRGWTTWLTGAHDSRVKAIAPMVIDVLNMPVNIDYQKVVWGDYSEEIADYVKLGIAQQMGTPGGNDLTRMIDPYSYRATLTMPKMIFMGTNDPYWPVDAIKNYIDSIPGENHICYTPNAGHDLGDKRKAFATLSAFFGQAVSGSSFNSFKYEVSPGEGSVVLHAGSGGEQFINAVLWSSSSSDQDFRNEAWADSVLNPADPGNINLELKYPVKGFRAFYLDLVFKAPAGHEYTQSTRMFVADSSGLLLRK